MKISHTGSLVSLFLGVPLGLLFIAVFSVVIFFAIAVEAKNTVVAVGIGGLYLVPLLAMTLAMVLGLFFTGRLAEYFFLKKQKLLLVSFKYSLVTNGFMWLSFIIAGLILTLVWSAEPDLMLNIVWPLIFFLVSVLISTFTIGLLICYVIKRILVKKGSLQ